MSTFPEPPRVDDLDQVSPKLRQNLQRWMSDLKRALSASGSGSIATQDEGVSVDTAATTLNFVGAGVAATDAGGHVTTVTIPGGGTGTVTSVAQTVPVEFSVAGSPVTTTGTLAISKATQSANTVWAGPTSGSAAAPTFRALVPADIPAAVGQALYGDGSDGDVTISAGTTTLTRDMYYNNLTINGTGKLATAGFYVRVQGTLDISAAPASAINNDGSNGNNAVGSTQGTAPAQPTVQQLPIGLKGSNGGAGGSGITGNAGGSVAALSDAMGGRGGAGGGTSNGAVLPVTPGAVTAWTNPPHFASVWPLGMKVVYNTGGSALTLNAVWTGNGGCGGGGGASNASSTSGAGGSGANPGNTLAVFARTINRSGSTAAAAISARGGTGGNGAAAVIGAGTGADGGGGGGGGGGGWVWLVYDFLLGSAATNCVDASGGTGGTAGNGVGAGRFGGDAGSGGAGGTINSFNLNTGVATTVTTHTAGSAGTAHSGTTGGTPGGAGGAATLTL